MRAWSMVRSSSSSCLARLGAAVRGQRTGPVPMAPSLGNCLPLSRVPHSHGTRPSFTCRPGYPYLSATSALSSERSSSPSRITSFLATWGMRERRSRAWVSYGEYLGFGGRRKWDRAVTSSYLRSESSAMCLASFSCISCSSIFSSSFMARFSMTFIPLNGRERGGSGVKTSRDGLPDPPRPTPWEAPCPPLTLISCLLSLLQLL